MNDALDLLVATFHAGTKTRSPELLAAIEAFLTGLEAGQLRAAAPDGNVKRTLKKGLRTKNIH